MLSAEWSGAYERDIKRLRKKHIDLDPLKEVIRLVLDNTPESTGILLRRHNMHTLVGKWSGHQECHVANAGDWLLIWSDDGVTAFFERTGTHNELFR